MNDNLITFDPPIAVNPNVISGDMVVTTAEVIPQDDPTQVIASIFGDGRVISVPFITDASTSIASALSADPAAPKERVPEVISRANSTPKRRCRTRAMCVITAGRKWAKWVDFVDWLRLR